MKGRLLKRSELKVGDLVIAPDDGKIYCFGVESTSGFYTPAPVRITRMGVSEAMAPIRRVSVSEVEAETLNGSRILTSPCTCTDLDNLYEWLPDTNPIQTLDISQRLLNAWYRNQVDNMGARINKTIINVPIDYFKTLSYSLHFPITKPNPTLKQKALRFFRSLALTADDKVLLEEGLEDPTGVPTKDGLDLMSEILWKENRVKVVELAKQMQAEKCSGPQAMSLN